MKIDFRKDSDRQYMIISPGPESHAFSSYRFRMLTENRISSLLPCRKAEIDCEELLYYDISGLISLDEYLRSNTIKSDTLQRFLGALLQLIEKLEDYLLTADNLILAPDYVFVSQKCSRFFFAALPARSGPLSRSMLRLSELFITKIPYNDKKGAEIGYSLYQSCITGKLTIGDLARLAYIPGNDSVNIERSFEKDPPLPESASVSSIESLMQTDEQPDKDHPKKKAGGFIGRLISAVKKDPGRRKKSRTEDMDLLRSLAEHPADEHEQLNEFSEGTVILQQKRDPETSWQALLISKADPGIRFSLTEDTYVIGKASGGADIIIDKKTVSRVHARIKKESGSYRVNDRGSKNGTYINGDRISDGKGDFLYDGDEISFADADFIYRIDKSPMRAAYHSLQSGSERRSGADHIQVKSNNQKLRL